jgi:cytochrome c oxidase cbb3-type subunit III
VGGMLIECSFVHHLRRDLFTVVRASQIKALTCSALLLCAALLVGSAGGVTAIASSQEARAVGQEGVQQDDQEMTQAQRSAATRAFLGLGPMPDKVAAARGAPLFAQSCAGCHGKSARGAMAPSLITSDRVLTDEYGEQLVPFLKKGSPENGMPAFETMSDQQLMDISEFLHLQVEGVANRGTYQTLNILVGNAAKGKAYLESRCMSCHTGETFAHMASKFRSPEKLQRNWIWPAREGNIMANVKTSEGTISGRVTQISDFRITLVDRSGQAHTIERGPGIEVQMKDQLAAHQEIVMTLANDDMHNVTAYLETLK